jgi:hypothetical protein
LLTILECADPKTLAVEELPALAIVLEAGDRSVGEQRFQAHHYRWCGKCCDQEHDKVIETARPWDWYRRKYSGPFKGDKK